MTVLVVGLLTAVGAGRASAEAITFAFTDAASGRAASAVFEIDAEGYLSVTLTNTSTADVLVPSDILTALFFDLAGGVALTEVSAIAGNVLSGASGNVGGEWAYGSGLAGAPRGATHGISSAGFGLFGMGTFIGPDLSPPAAVNGLNYGITSGGDDETTGNQMVTGGVPLIQNSVVFRFRVSENFSLASISNVSFQYGTNLEEPNHTVPEPGTLLLLGFGLLATGLVLRTTPKGRRTA